RVEHEGETDDRDEAHKADDECGATAHAVRSLVTEKIPPGLMRSTARRSTSTATGESVAPRYPLTQLSSTPTTRPPMTAPGAESRPPTTAIVKAYTNTRSVAWGLRPSSVGMTSSAARPLMADASIQPSVIMRLDRTPSRRARSGENAAARMRNPTLVLPNRRASPTTTNATHAKTK